MGYDEKTDKIIEELGEASRSYKINYRIEKLKNDTNKERHMVIINDQ